jgi:hypothetical protein
MLPQVNVRITQNLVAVLALDGNDGLTGSTTRVIITQSVLHFSSISNKVASLV